MTIAEARTIIKTTNSPYLKRDLKKYIKRQQRKEGAYGTDRATSERNKRKAL